MSVYTFSDTDTWPLSIKIPSQYPFSLLLNSQTLVNVCHNSQTLYFGVSRRLQVVDFCQTLLVFVTNTKCLVTNTKCLVTNTKCLVTKTLGQCLSQ